MKPKPLRQAIWQHDAWPAFTWRSRDVDPMLREAMSAQMSLAGVLHSIGFENFSDIQHDLWSQEAMATAAIEGQNLDLQAVRSSVGHKLGLASPKSKDRDVEGLLQMMQEVVQQHNEPMTHERLCAWQQMLFPNNADKPLKLRVQVGEYRTHAEPMQIVSGVLGKEVAHYTAPPSKTVPKHMAKFVYWLNATRPNAPARSGLTRPSWLVRAALAHLWFETIHPFEDGNGRVGRALADYVLAQELNTSQRIFSLSRQLLAQRREYYSQLEAAQHAPASEHFGIDVTPWVVWFAQVFTRGCEHSRSVIRLATQKAAFWQKASLVDLNERQRKVLQRLLDVGDGGFLGGLSAEKYMQIAQVSKATATRDLSSLYRAGLLAVQGQGKSTRFAIAIVGWHQDFSRHVQIKDDKQIT